MKTRTHYLLTFTAFLIVEILIALFVHDAFVRPYMGDALVVVVLYCFVRIFIPQGVRLLPLYIFLFAAAVEILQYFKIVELLGLENHTFFRVLIGSVFDIKDIICYGAGCAAIAVWSYVWGNLNKKARI